MTRAAFDSNRAPRTESEFATLIYLHCCLAAIVYTLILLCMFWPGLIANDSVQRHWIAMSIVEAGKSSEVRVPRIVFDHTFPPASTLVIATLRMLTGSWGVMTALQAFFFFLSGCLLSVSLLGKRLGFIVWSAISLAPPVWNHAAAMLPDVWVAAAMQSLMFVLLTPRPQSPSRRVLIAVIVAASSCVAFGFRFNTLTIAPVLVVLVFVGPGVRAEHVRYRASLAATVIGAAVLTSLLPRLIPFRECHSTGPFLAWEHVSMLKVAHDKALIDEYSLDEATGASGSTLRAVNLHNWYSSHSLIFGADAPMPSGQLRQPEFGRKVSDTFFRLARSRPGLYLRTKSEVWITMLGLRHKGGYYWVGPDVPAWAEGTGCRLGVRPSFVSRRRIASQLGERATLAVLPVWMPYMWIATPMLALLYRRIARCPSDRAAQTFTCARWLLLTAVAYYSAFLLISPGFEWRYSFPSFTLAWIAIACIIRASLRAPQRSANHGEELKSHAAT